MRASFRTRVYALAIATFLFVADQVSKAVAVAMAAGASGAFALHDPSFNAGLLLGLHFNPAAVAGFGSGLPQAVFVVVGLAMAAVGVLYFGFAEDRARVLFGALLLAGALGNSLDRIHYGAVVDWLGPAWIGPIEIPLVANIADTVLIVACALMLTTLVREAWGRMRRPPKGIRRRKIDFRPAEDSPPLPATDPGAGRLSG